MPDIDIADLHQKELLYAMERAEREYKSFCDTWDGIDRKAQITTTIAGAFLAALFTFIPRFDKHADVLLIVLVLTVMAVLLVSIAASLWALSARSSTLPPCASDFLPKLLTRIESESDMAQFKEKQLAMYQEWAGEWLEANASVDLANHSKSRPLWMGQVALFVAAVMTVFIGAVMLVSATRADAQQTGSEISDGKADAPKVQECPAIQAPSALPAITIENYLSSDAGACCQASTKAHQIKPKPQTPKNLGCQPE
ncbi:hypothetical protein M0D69_11205 [Caballeronia sp. SEWSISQ10-4 2]|uniref:hypothetical protein n=1 Tax=Caballeronia sp. SEWSISQ10-4 2 TaxID=2937438 RepID=UPI0026542EE1|nr:hypothetical protein [Caballeronia sp. SEWSISQ10-4 2]MDN7178579.1 hypothetical protein [Caballeronia sp. SEWSISQ10-4 2]